MPRPNDVTWHVAIGRVLDIGPTRTLRVVIVGAASNCKFPSVAMRVICERRSVGTTANVHVFEAVVRSTRTIICCAPAPDFCHVSRMTSNPWSGKVRIFYLLPKNGIIEVLVTSVHVTGIIVLRRTQPERIGERDWII